MVRTQISLDRADHLALKKEALERKVSLSGLVRLAVREHLMASSTRKTFSKEEFLSIVGIGESGERDVSVRHDRHIATG